MAPVGQFPLFRLAALLARQLSTPVAAKIKVYARTHPRFSRAVCMRTGRAYHACELRFKMWSLALRQPRVVPPISDQVALDCGANILGEIAVFGLGGLIIIFEVNRQMNKQEDKELDEASRWLALLVSLEELRRELTLQQQDIDRLQDTLRRLAPLHQPRMLAAAPVPNSPVFPSSSNGAFSSADASLMAKASFSTEGSSPAEASLATEGSSSAEASLATEGSSSAEASLATEGSSSADVSSSGGASLKEVATSRASGSSTPAASLSVPVPAACLASPHSPAKPLPSSPIKSPPPPPPSPRF